MSFFYDLASLCFQFRSVYFLLKFSLFPLSLFLHSLQSLLLVRCSLSLPAVTWVGHSKVSLRLPFEQPNLLVFPPCVVFPPLTRCLLATSSLPPHPSLLYQSLPPPSLPPRASCSLSLTLTRPPGPLLPLLVHTYRPHSLPGGMITAISFLHLIT